MVGAEQISIKFAAVVHTGLFGFRSNVDLGFSLLLLLLDFAWWFEGDRLALELIDEGLHFSVALLEDLYIGIVLMRADLATLPQPNLHSRADLLQHLLLPGIFLPPSTVQQLPIRR